MKKMRVLLLCLVTVCPFEALAWDGEVRGQINYVEVNSGSYSFRVTLKDAPALCGNGHTWAYISESDNNYEAYVSTLLAAKHAGMEVRLYTNQSGTNGYCHVGYIFSY